MNLDFKKFANSQGVNSMTLHDYSRKIVETSNTTPYIFEEREKRGMLMDVFSRLMIDRSIFLGTSVSDDVCNIIMAQLLYMENIEKKKTITMYITSPGGDVVAGNGLLDCMDFISSDVETVNVGMAASMGAVILSNGAKGKRKALPRSRTMIHQLSSGTKGTFSDMQRDLDFSKSLRDELYETLAKNCNKTFEQIEKDCDRDNWMTAKQAEAYGLIDSIIATKR